ncbi:MAG: hypothetical protein EPN41_02245 [Candidimonas sp.]|nr:MAG: hypothetical protein EPN41_02245 [Candidimonas sp.]
MGLKIPGIELLVARRVETVLGITLGEQPANVVRAGAESVPQPQAAANVGPGELSPSQAPVPQSAGAHPIAGESFDTALRAGGVPPAAAPADGQAPAARAESATAHPEPSARVRLSAGLAPRARETLSPVVDGARSTIAARNAAGLALLTASQASPSDERAALLAMLPERNPALAAQTNQTNLDPAVRDALLNLIDNVFKTGAFDASLLADAQSGHIAHEIVAQFLSQRHPPSEPAAPAAEGAQQRGDTNSAAASGTSGSPPASVGGPAPISHAQIGLEALHSHELALEILAWPGVPATLRFAKAEPRGPDLARSHHEADRAPPENVWHCVIDITLPRLGPLSIDLRHDTLGVDVQIASASASTRAALLGALGDGMELARGGCQRVHIVGARAADPMRTEVR